MIDTSLVPLALAFLALAAVATVLGLVGIAIAVADLRSDRGRTAPVRRLPVADQPSRNAA